MSFDELETQSPSQSRNSRNPNKLPRWRDRYEDNDQVAVADGWGAGGGERNRAIIPGRRVQSVGVAGGLSR